MSSTSGSASKPKWPGFVKAKMRDISNEAQSLYQSPNTQFLPSLNAWTTQGIQNRAGIAGSGNTVAGAGAAEAQRILNGDYLDLSNNPSFQRNMQAAMGAASGRFAGSGRVGSGAYAGALGDAATGVAADMYNVERQRQMQALDNIGALTGAQYSDAAALEDAGRAMDERKQAEFDWPYARLDRYAASIYGSPASQITGQNSSTPFNWMSMLGGMMQPKTINLPGMG